MLRLGTCFRYLPASCTVQTFPHLAHHQPPGIRDRPVNQGLVPQVPKPKKLSLASTVPRTFAIPAWPYRVQGSGLTGAPAGQVPGTPYSPCRPTQNNGTAGHSGCVPPPQPFISPPSTTTTTSCPPFPPPSLSLPSLLYKQSIPRPWPPDPFPSLSLPSPIFGYTSTDSLPTTGHSRGFPIC